MRQRKTASDRKEEILDTALLILHEEGRPALTVGTIADRIGVSEAAVYKHFDSKEDVVRGMAEKAFSVDFLETAELEFEEPSEMLEGILRSLFSWLDENPEVTAMLFHKEYFAGYPGVIEIFRQHREEKRARIESMVSMGKSSGFFREGVEPERFASIMMGSVRVTVHRWRENDFSYPLESEAESLASHLAEILDPGEPAQDL